MSAPCLGLAFGFDVLKGVFPPRREGWDTSGCPNAHPAGRNGVEHSEALRRVVRAGSRGTIDPQRGILDGIHQQQFSVGMERSGMEAEA